MPTALDHHAAEPGIQRHSAQWEFSLFFQIWRIGADLCTFLCRKGPLTIMPQNLESNGTQRTAKWELSLLFLLPLG